MFTDSNLDYTGSIDVDSIETPTARLAITVSRGGIETFLVYEESTCNRFVGRLCLWDSHVVILSTEWTRLLTELHKEHPGISKRKALAVQSRDDQEMTMILQVL